MVPLQRSTVYTLESLDDCLPKTLTVITPDYHRRRLVKEGKPEATEQFGGLVEVRYLAAAANARLDPASSYRTPITLS